MGISLVTAIAVDRYVAVRAAPTVARGLRSPRQAAAVRTALWVLVASLLGLRWALGAQEGGFCFSSSSRQGSNTAAFSLLGFFLPLAVLLLCSLQVVTALGQRPTASPTRRKRPGGPPTTWPCSWPASRPSAWRPEHRCHLLRFLHHGRALRCQLLSGHHLLLLHGQGVREASSLASMPTAKAHRTRTLSVRPSPRRPVVGTWASPRLSGRSCLLGHP